ncbi:unnamed protein product [Blepharisma stoltei]|uniref:Ras-related protein Rab-7b n=1 Tax=Blepharisma stoltei TaxID=1481888 RepID=A0AAU9K3R1_9CILI|nr:unnamed protein product [Blepharisma stoltei]
MASKKTQLKIIILGDSGVGKTSLLNRFVETKFTQLYRATIGADFLMKEIEVEGQTVNLQLWDTAGQERFQSLGMSFYRGADCCLLVYDMTNQKTFESLGSWKDEFLKASCPDDPKTFPFIVIGNKCDREIDRAISYNRAQQWANSNDVVFLETSAKDDLNVNEAFIEGARKAMKREQKNQFILNTAVNLKAASPVKKKKTKCC